MILRAFHWIVGIVVLLAGLGCGDDAHPTPPPTGIGDAVTVAVHPAEALLESINDSLLLTVVARDRNGRVVPGVVAVWSVDSTRVATAVDGIVVARGSGTANVRATVFTQAGTALLADARITVTPRPRSWSVMIGGDTIGLGGRTELQLLGYDARGTATSPTSSVTWHSADAGVASVDATGMLTGRGLGTVTITGSTAVGSATALVVVVPPSGIRVSAGALNSCALSRLGEAYCWGFNDQGQLGTRTSPETCNAGPVAGSYPCALGPQKVDGGLSFRSITNGFEHTCGLDGDGRAYCWGANDRGQLGTEAAADVCVAAVFGDIGPCSYTPIPVATSVRFMSIGAGYRTTCGLSTDQRVYCWGNNGQGSVGVPMNGDDAIPQPTEVAGALSFRFLSVGWLHACGVATDGMTRCWGHNGSGQLGDGSWQPRFAPTGLQNARPFTLLAAGKEHTCAITAGEGAYCWGAAVGFVPTGVFGPNWESAAIPTVDRTPMDTLVSGAAFSCGLYSGGWMRCWGDNTGWKLGGPLPGGYPANLNSLIPVALPLRSTFEQITAGFAHACGVRTGGAVYCWGDGIEGELGDGSPHVYGSAQQSSRPVRVTLPFR